MKSATKSISFAKQRKHETTNTYGERERETRVAGCPLAMPSKYVLKFKRSPGRLFIRFLTQTKLRRNQSPHTHTHKTHIFIQLGRENKVSEREHNQLTAHRIGYCIQITKCMLVYVAIIKIFAIIVVSLCK